MSYTFVKSSINPEALEQYTHWFDRKGREYEIKKMSSFHAAGACRKLFGAFGPSVTTTPLYVALQKQSYRGR